MSRKAPAPRHAGVSRPVRQERGRKVGQPDQGQRGDRGLTASSIESVACPAYPSSISPLISWEKLMPPSVTVARAWGGALYSPRAAPPEGGGGPLFRPRVGRPPGPLGKTPECWL